MPSIDERVSYLEGRVEEHARGFGKLRDTVLQLGLTMNRRFDAVDSRVDALDQKVDRFRSELSAGILALDQKMSRQFLWILGV